MPKPAGERYASARALSGDLKAVPQPWLYEGRDATKKRKRAAAAVRSRASTHEKPATSAVTRSWLLAASGALRSLLRGFARLGAWALAVASLIAVGIAATMIYLLSSDSEHPEPLRALERPLRTFEAALSSRAPSAKDAGSADAHSASADHLEAPPEPQIATPERTKQPPVDEAKRPRGRDPWQTPVPRELRPMRWKIEVGQEGDREMLKDLKRYVRRHAEDPRGPLLLARLYRNRNAWNKTVEYYKLAFDRDPSSRGDPRMLKDLVHAVTRAESSWRATALIPDVYGTEALTEIKRVREHTYDNEARLRLDQLAHTLSL